MDNLYFDDDTDIQAILTGRDDEFVGIENDTLPDFTQLEHFINSENDEHNNYFADTLANQEASRHSGSLSTAAATSGSHNGGDVIMVDATSLLATPRPLTTTIRMGSSGYTNPQQLHGAMRSATNGQYNSGRTGIHGSAFNVAHAMPESPPDSASEPPYSPPETNRSGSSIGGSPLNDHCSNQRYVLPPSETYGSSLFGTSLDLKNDMAHPHHQQHSNYLGSPSNLSQPQSMPASILSVALLQNAAPSSANMGTSHAVGLNPSSTPATIYTIEDHGGGNLNSGSNNSGPGSTANPACQKKRKLSLSESFSNGSNPASGNKSLNVKQEPQPSPESISNHQSPRQVAVVGADEDYSYEFSADSSMFNDSYQCIRFQAFQQNTWHLLFDRNLKELPLPSYRVDADKGFNFSNTDDAFVCQKKNHFQITCHVQQNGEPYFVKSAEGLKKVDNFYLHFFGVKAEAPTQVIRVEQSQSDRSKKPFHPVLLELQQDQVSKITVGRLHFNETTANNMRKKGKPNPDQRFFNLVVSLQAHCGDTTYTIVAHSSERIIVRASNPGMFENETEQSWQRGTTSDSVFYAGRVGINTDRPDEALVVHGNLKITGHLVQPSDRRAKEGIKEADTKEQLRNVQALRVVHYKYTEEFAETAGLKEDERDDTGVIAQEVESIIPDAVRPAGNIILPDGRQIENFLVVNKERIFMENVGAVKELCKVTGNLETRIDELEKMNTKFSKLKRLDSVRSSTNGSTGKPALSLDLSYVSNVASSVVRRPKRCNNVCSPSSTSTTGNICANRFVQATVIFLVTIMAFCLIAMASLYILEWQKRNSDIVAAGLGIKKSGSEHHTILNYTEPSIEDYAYLSDGGHMPHGMMNKTYQLSSSATSLAASNSTDVSFITSSRSIPLNGKPSDNAAESNAHQNSSIPSRSFTSLTSIKPNPIGRPDTCPTSAPCQVYCCAPSMEGVLGTLPPIGTTSSRQSAAVIDNASTERSSDTGTSGLVSSQAPTTEMLTNNVESFSGKEGKNRNFRGPSDGGGAFEQRASFGQFFLQKPRDKKPVRVSRTKRHLLTQQSGTGVRGPAGSELMLTRLRSSSTKATTQSPGWDGRVSYIRLVGASFNVTLGPSYCMAESDEYIRCLNGDASNYTYGVPLSKHMPDRSLTLQFHFTTSISLQPDHCPSPVRAGACPDGQRDPLGANSIQRGPTVNLADSVARTFFVDVGRSSNVAYRLRFPVLRGDTADLCDKPSTSVGDKFVEYNLVFYRVCD